MRINGWTKAALAAAMTVAMALTSVAPASAFDGYRDRNGIYYGIHLAGAGVFDFAGENAGGFGGGLEIGAGVSDWLTLGLIFDTLYFPSKSIAEPVVVRPAIRAQVFLPFDLFVDLTAGMPIWNFLEGLDGSGETATEVGFSAGGGLGLEVWTGASEAMQISTNYEFSYLPEIEEPSHFLVARVTFRWY